mgnify:CR=1 FL=1
MEQSDKDNGKDQSQNFSADDSPAETFDILFRGETLPGTDRQAAREQVAKSFKLDDAALDRLFSGSVISLKRNIDKETAERIFQRLWSAGAIAKIVSSLSGATPEEKASKETETRQADNQTFTLAPLGTDVLEKSMAAEQDAVPVSLEHLGLEPVGSNIIEETEKEAIEPVEVDTGHLSLE